MLTRRVRRLHVRAAAEDEARHAATLLADALRTASLSGVDEGRFVVIRRLPLGRISPRASAASLALQIERAAADVMANAVAYNLPTAFAANAVVFADRAEAIVALATLHAQRRSTPEWFWPEVVPGWTGNPSRHERWTLLVDAAHRSPEAAVVAAAVVERAIAAGVEEELLASISRHQAVQWLRLEGWSRLAPVAAMPAWRWPAGGRGHALRRWKQAWSPDDARLVWLATLISVAEQPSRAGDPRLPARIAFGLQAHEAVARASHHDRLQTIDGEVVHDAVRASESRRPTELSPAPGTALFDAHDASFDAAHPLPSIEPRRQPAAISDAIVFGGPAAEYVTHADTPTIHSDAFEDPLPHTALGAAATSFAGLLFLIPVLNRLQFPAFLAEHPHLLESAFPARLLSVIGHRVGMPPDDPLGLALRAEGADDADGAASVAAWLVAVRRWCRRTPRIGLATLIRRRGTVHVSRTHIDAHFRLSLLDVRVRRWALDVNPGWVPWLGRVVTFTYGEET